MNARGLFGRKSVGAPASQSWFPIREIRDGCLFRDDGAVVGGLSVSPLNLALKSPRETRTILTQVYAIFNSVRTPWQVLSLYRPLDLAHYVDSLHDQLWRVNAERATLLRPYLAWVLAQQAGEQAMERRYYCLFTRTGPDAMTLHQESLPPLAQEWNRIRGMRAMVLDNAAWESLLFGFFHPTKLQQEMVPDGWTELTKTTPDAAPMPIVQPEEVNPDAFVDAMVSS
jgi:hypothetical protein